MESLSRENRNVFQKIFDEIKYLCKVATAGSQEARQRMGEDPTLYDTDEDEGVETTRDKLEVRQKSLQWELQENRRLKESAMQAFDKQIEALQEKYDGKKHKDSKSSQALLRWIQKETRLRSDIAAEYDS